jgi:hypothetical protein
MTQCTCRRDIICGGCGEPVYQPHGHSVDDEGEISMSHWPKSYEPCEVHRDGFIFYVLSNALDLANEITNVEYMDEETIMFAKQFLKDTEDLRQEIAFRKRMAGVDKAEEVLKKIKND